MSQPEFCKTAECPLFRNDFCPLDREILNGWQSAQGRKKEREKLKKQAEENPLSIREDCSQTTFESIEYHYEE